MFLLKSGAKLQQFSDISKFILNKILIARLRLCYKTLIFNLLDWLKGSNFAVAKFTHAMAKKQKIVKEPTAGDIKKIRLRSSTPLEKVEDALSVNDIIKDDVMLIKVHFVSDLMVKHMTNQEISAEFESKFGESLPLSKVSYMKKLVRAVYMAEISANKDELVAEELMHAEWEIRQLQEYWEKSKGIKKKTVKHDADSDGTDLTTYELHETTETTEDQIGDLNAMKVIGSVRERVIKLLGLNAQKQQDDGDSDKRPRTITVNVVGNMREIKVEEAQEVK